MNKITPYTKNAKKHPKAQVDQIARSIEEFGMNQRIVVDKAGVIIVGHGRYEALKQLNWSDEDIMKHVEVVDLTPAQAKAYRLADNRLNESDWDMELVIEELRTLDPDMIELTGFDPSLLDDKPYEAPDTNKLRDRFLMPPFSVLNARDGQWQDRKRTWLALGIKSEEGRGEEKSGTNETGGLLMKSWTAHPEFYNSKSAKEKELGRSMTTAEYLEEHYVPPTSGAYASGTSIFDPVLCELMYLWFAPNNANVLDPFAGGSVRGIVAHKLGHQYYGTELRTEQVLANRQQGIDLLPDETQPVWIDDDAMNVKTHFKDISFDMLLTCPPYADLEVYSDDPRDISNMKYFDFKEAYFEILKRSASLLKENSFAVCVVGEVRGKNGAYIDFVPDTIKAFELAGMHYYNEIILVTAIGSLAMRAGKQFETSRKIGESHQNILVFWKGDPAKAKDSVRNWGISGDIFTIPEEEEEALA